MSCSSPHTILHCSETLCSLEIHCPGDTPATVHDSSTQTPSKSVRELPLSALSQAPVRDSAGTGSLAFCILLASVFIILYCMFISILFRGLKQGDRQPHGAKARGMLHVMDPGSPAALHTEGCAFRKASLRSESAEGGKKHSTHPFHVQFSGKSKTELLGVTSNSTSKCWRGLAGEGSE